MAKVKVKFEASDVKLEIPKLFDNASLSTIKDEAVREFANHYVTEFTKYFLSGKAPLLLGSSGVGKTFVAAAIARALAFDEEFDYTAPVLWIDTVERLNHLLDLRDFRLASEYFDKKRKIKKTPVVVLDDVLQLREFERIRELLFEIVNYRYSEKLPTIITANIQNTKEHWTELTREVGSPLARRMREMSEGLAILIN